jgi:hypothetical protein
MFAAALNLYMTENKYHNSVSELLAAGKKYEQEHPERFAKISPIKQRREIVDK